MIEILASGVAEAIVMEPLRPVRSFIFGGVGPGWTDSSARQNVQVILGDASVSDNGICPDGCALQLVGKSCR